MPADAAATWDVASVLRAPEPAALEGLFREADHVRRRHVGDAVHLRGLVEIGNHCVRSCAYCGLRAPRAELPRYRMTLEEIVACAREARACGCGTLVLQAGEDPGLAPEWVAEAVRRVKDAEGLAVTLSLGERAEDELALWRAAGADRYLLRFETSDRALFDRIHPPATARRSDRIELLRVLRTLGYETGSGVMVGLPGQTRASIATDIETFAALDLDMIGIGPYIPHPDTPLGRLHATHDDADVPATHLAARAVLALARLACPEANIPSTTALALSSGASGHANGLACGANVIMITLTPPRYRGCYEIYPGKGGAGDYLRRGIDGVARLLDSLGRTIGVGPGPRVRRQKAGMP